METSQIWIMDEHFVLSSVYMITLSPIVRPGMSLSCDIDLKERCMHASWRYVPDSPPSPFQKFEYTFTIDLLLTCS
jgi:hypothetical protein